MFEVNASLFRLVALFQGTDETRYYLQDVYIEKHPKVGVFLVATDGHRMLVAHDEKGSVDEPVIVQIGKDQLKACKAGRNEAKPRRLASSAGGKEVFVTTHDGEKVAVASKWEIEATFPDWRRAMKGANSLGGHDAFNASLVKSFAEVGKELVGNELVSIETGYDGGPALIRFANVDHVVGLLMPARWKTAKGYPAFLDFEPNPLPEPPAEN